MLYFYSNTTLPTDICHMYFLMTWSQLHFNLQINPKRELLCRESFMSTARREIMKENPLDCYSRSESLCLTSAAFHGNGRNKGNYSWGFRPDSSCGLHSSWELVKYVFFSLSFFSSADWSWFQQVYQWSNDIVKD